jgi:hypothetical protein
MEQEDIYQIIQKLKIKSKKLQMQIEAYELLLEDIKIRDRKKQFTA